MKVSIVIPAHNEENSIAKTLEAACAIQYSDFEIIVVDNASSDSTSEIAKKFPVKVVFEEKKGLLHARQRGLDEASGDIIANMDADCLPEDNWLSLAVDHFKDSKVVAVSGPYDYYDGSKSFRNSSMFLQKNVYVLMNKIMHTFKKGGVLIGGNNLIRISSLKKVGGYNTNILFYGEDTNTAKRVSKTGHIVFDPKIKMKTSARRFQEEGMSKIAIKYFYHFFAQTFGKKK